MNLPLYQVDTWALAADICAAIKIAQ